MAKIIPQPHGGKIQNWEKGESGNPKGRRPRTLKILITELEKKGYKRASQFDVMEMYEILLNLTEDEIKDRVNDPRQPILVKIVGKAMLDPKNNIDMIERMLDRAHGKSRQSIDLSGEVKNPLTVYLIEQYGENNKTTPKAIPSVSVSKTIRGSDSGSPKRKNILGGSVVRSEDN